MKPIQRVPIDPTTLQEFKTFFKYLAFVACAAKAPVRQKMLHDTLARIAKAGEAENIERWCWWTPDQLSLLDLADRLSRVILIGGNGTGKTVMLDAFATKTAKAQPDENVIFAINQKWPSARPLLLLDLQVKYEKLKLSNVNVKNFRRLSELSDVNLPNATLCLDEISMRDVIPEDLNAIHAKSLWVVIRDTGDHEQDPEEYIRSQFPDWVVLNLDYPLRTSKNLSEKVRRGRVYGTVHTNNFNSSLQIALNMPLGPEPVIFPRTHGSYCTRLDLALSRFGKDQRALIILDCRYMQPTSEEIQVAKTITTHQELAEKSDPSSANILVAIEAVKACQRPHGPPLLWFRSDFEYVSSGKPFIKEWMKGKNRNISGRDLLTDTECVPGYEADFVIYLGLYQVSAFMSRCRGQFIHIE